MKKEEKFTEGSIIMPLVRFTMPIFFSLLLQVLYGAVDLIVVGQFASQASTSAVATGSQFVHLLLMIISGLCMGTTILIGQKIGAGKSHEVGKIIGSTIYLYGIITVIVTLFMTVFASQISALVNAPVQAFSETTAYIRISGYGVLFLTAYNVFGAIFRGIGDSKTPLFAVIIATILNIAGDIILVVGFHMGAYGAAFATVFAQAISVLVSIYVVRKRKLPFQFERKEICFDNRMIKKILLLGAPVAVQNGLIQISFLGITAIVNDMGVSVSAGVGITEKISGFLLLIQIAFGEALAAFTAHNVGAKKYDRAKKGLYDTFIISVAIGIFIMWAAYFHGDIMLRVFTNKPDVLNASREYLKAYSFDIFTTSFLFCFVGYFNGFGKTQFTMWQGIIGAVLLRLPLAYMLSKQVPVSLFQIGLAIPMSSFAEDIMCLVYFGFLTRKLKNKGEEVLY